jgi:hypothetical protein
MIEKLMPIRGQATSALDWENTAPHQQMHDAFDNVDLLRLLLTGFRGFGGLDG